MLGPLRCSGAGVALCAAAGLSSLGCVGSLRDAGDPADASVLQARCQVGASQTSVLVTEWPAAERANLEASLGRGAVAVAFSGCAMQVLPQCVLPGRYTWMRTSPSTDVLRVRDEQELFTKLPLGALALQAELRQSGELELSTTVAGQHRLEGFSAPQVPHTEACAAATHVLSALSVGASSIASGQQRSGEAGAEVAGYGSAGGRLAHSARLLRVSGELAACGAATEQGASPSCNSPVQAFLEPVPGRAEVAGAPGTVKVDFVSADPDLRWDVYVDDEATCSTPCARWVDPSRPLTLKARGGATMMGAASLTLDHLSTTLGPQRLVAHDTSRGELVTGITFTALGGLAVLTGITLMSVGCGGDAGAACTGGLVTFAAGAPVTAGAIWLMLDAAARADLRPIFGGGQGPRVLVGPGGVFGQF